MRRRNFLRIVAAASVAAAIAPTPSFAQAWPDKPVKIIVPFAAGGATDLLARPWADALGKAFNGQFVIENRGGASGLIGAEAAHRSAPDGYTFLFSSNSTTVFQPLLRKVNYDSKTFTLVARMGDSVSGFVVHPKHGFKTLQDLIDYAKKNPGKLTFGSSGPGTTTHLRYEMLVHKTGIDVLHVPYRGGADSITDLLAGVIDIMNEGSTLPHAKAGKLTLLNVNHSERFAEFPDVPTLAEAGVKDADVPVWFALYGPPNTPKEIVEKLNAKINEFSATADMKGKMQLASAVPVVQNLADLQKHYENDFKSIETLIKAANIKIEP
jgi:tripartite-type tricarboxylate transporter receptor subunit TctC